MLPWMIGLFVIAVLVWPWAGSDSVALHGTLGRVVVGINSTRRSPENPAVDSFL
jgi:hypothetical protein